jgi:hypothetical protein
MALEFGARPDYHLESSVGERAEAPALVGILATRVSVGPQRRSLLG